MLVKLMHFVVSGYFITQCISQEHISHVKPHHRNLRFDYHKLEKKICGKDATANPCNACYPIADTTRVRRGAAYEKNIEVIDQEISRLKNDTNAQTKIVFLGDSITEQFIGRSSGIFKMNWSRNKIVFDKYFGNGVLALGVTGNTFAQLHWRIRNGEVPNELNPKIWWLHIGTNNFRSKCSDKEIVLGIMHIVEEIRSRKPNAIIVVNAILPRSDINNLKWYKISKTNKELGLSVNALNDDNVYFFDAFHSFYDKSIQNIRQRLHVGHIHLNSKGYEVWAESIVKWTKENLDMDLT